MPNWRQVRTKSGMKSINFRVTFDEWKIVMRWCAAMRAVSPLGGINASEDSPGVGVRGFFYPMIALRLEELKRGDLKAPTSLSLGEES